MNFLDEKQINLIPINVKQKRVGVFTYRKINTFSSEIQGTLQDQ